MLHLLCHCFVLIWIRTVLFCWLLRRFNVADLLHVVLLRFRTPGTGSSSLVGTQTTSPVVVVEPEDPLIGPWNATHGRPVVVFIISYYNCIKNLGQCFPTWRTFISRGAWEVTRGTPNFHYFKIINENAIEFPPTSYHGVYVSFLSSVKGCANR